MFYYSNFFVPFMSRFSIFKSISVIVISSCVLLCSGCSDKEIQSLKQKIAEQNITLITQSKEIAQLSADKQALNSQFLTNQEETNKKISLLEAQVKEYDEQIIVLKQQLDNNQNVAAINTLNAEKIALQKQVQTLESQKKKLSNKIYELASLAKKFENKPNANHSKEKISANKKQ